MKIFLVDNKSWLKVTYKEARKILCSGLKPNEWTCEKIKMIVMH